MSKRTPILAAIAIAAGTALTASADYTGLAVEEATDAGSLALGLAVVDLYATFDHVGDAVLTSTALGVVTTDPAGYYQHALGTDTAPMDSLIAIDPTLVYDSFYTVGTHTTALIPSAFGVDVDSAAFNTAGVLNGTWSAMPGGTDGIAGADGKVLLARLTVNAGESINGTMMVNWQDGATGAPGFGGPESVSYTTVPAPGAIALLGAAGIIGRRRRRNA